MAEFAKRVKKWMGATRCDFCSAALSLSPWFVNGRVSGRGMWALMCHKCWATHGCGNLGTGHGQKYDGKTLEKLEG